MAPQKKPVPNKSQKIGVSKPTRKHRAAKNQLILHTKSCLEYQQQKNPTPIMSIRRYMGSVQLQPSRKKGTLDTIRKARDAAKTQLKEVEDELF